LRSCNPVYAKARYSVEIIKQVMLATLKSVHVHIVCVDARQLMLKIVSVYTERIESRCVEIKFV